MRMARCLCAQGQIRLCGDRIVVVEYRDAHVTALSLGLNPLWRYSRRGSGPGEIRPLGDLSCDGEGRVWIPDEGDARIHVLGPGGTYERALPMERLAQRLLVHPAERTMTIVTRDQRELSSD